MVFPNAISNSTMKSMPAQDCKLTIISHLLQKLTWDAQELCETAKGNKCLLMSLLQAEVKNVVT